MNRLKMKNRKRSDLFAGIVCLGFSSIGIILLDKSEISTWLIILFFGLGTIVLLSIYINPNLKFFKRESNLNKRLSEDEFMFLHNSTGIFEYTNDGFELPIEKEHVLIKWIEIQKITAYKKDLFTTDEIWLIVEVDNDKSFEINETTPGWYQFIKKIEMKFQSISNTWFKDISVPAFERNETVLYERTN